MGILGGLFGTRGAAKRNAPADAASGFDGAVRETSLALAVEIERRLRRNVNWSEEPRAEILRSSLLLVLHLTDRIAFARMSTTRSDAFMSSVLASLARNNDEADLRDGYNSAQKKYSTFRELLPEKGKGTGGTLFWEFSKSVCLEHNDTNPAEIMLIALYVTNCYRALVETFEKCIPR